MKPQGSIYPTFEISASDSNFIDPLGNKQGRRMGQQLASSALNSCDACLMHGCPPFKDQKVWRPIP